MSSNELFSRGQALGGLPLRRASFLLFLIESHTARMAAHSRQAAEFFPSEELARERDLAFLEAFALGREPPLRPTIQDLERYAPRWAHLAPQNPRLRAAIAHLLGRKYRFAREDVSGLRAALGLDEEAVQRAFNAAFNRPLETIYAPRVAWVERLRWALSSVGTWFESLPPFWITFTFMLGASFAQSILALPIAMAGVGPLAGVLLLLLIGSSNTLTTACLAEAAARSSDVRYGSAFIGRMTAAYLGNTGSMLFTAAVTARSALVLLASYIGLSVTLAGFTGAPGPVWAGLLTLLILRHVLPQARKSSLSTIAALGAANVGLVLILTVLAAAHLRAANLLYANLPFVGDRPFDLSLLSSAVGVCLMCYFGHPFVVQCAKVVLPRDPSGRALICGNVAVMAAMLVVMGLWLVAVSGALGPERLARQRGTALGPLAEEVGPSARVLGSLSVCLLLGLAALRGADILVNTVRERLPGDARRTLVLPRRRGSLLFRPRGQPDGSPTIGVTYLGQAAGRAHFRFDVQVDGALHRVEMAVAGHLEAAALQGQIPELRSFGVRLARDVLDVGRESVRVQATSPLAMTFEGDWDELGLRVAEILEMADAQRELVLWIMRRGEVSLAEAAARAGADERAVGAALDALAARGFVRKMEKEGGPHYRAQHAVRRGRRLPVEIWTALTGDTAEPAAGAHRSWWARAAAVVRRAWEALLSGHGRLAVALSPVLLVFSVAEVFLLQGFASYAAVLAFCGVIVVPLATGVFPVLLVSSRRKGEIAPGANLRGFGHPLILSVVYLAAVGILFLYGLVIWQGAVERAIAVIVGGIVLAATAAIVRRGAFAPRVVIVLRDDGSAGGRAVFAVTASGQPAEAEVRLGYPDGERALRAAAGEVSAFASLRSATFRLPAGRARELKVWARRSTPDGDSEGLAAIAEVDCGVEAKRLDLKLSGGQAVLPVSGDECRVKIILEENNG
jgi:hypothetical protein